MIYLRLFKANALYLYEQPVYAAKIDASLNFRKALDSMGAS